MKIMKIALKVEGDDGWRKCDAIVHEGKLWLVTRWLENSALKIAKPERIIQMDGLGYKRSSTPGADWVLQKPVPESIFRLDHGQSTPAPFFSIALPDIAVDMPGNGKRH